MSDKDFINFVWPPFDEGKQRWAAGLIEDCETTPNPDNASWLRVFWITRRTALRPGPVVVDIRRLPVLTTDPGGDVRRRMWTNCAQGAVEFAQYVRQLDVLRRQPNCESSQCPLRKQPAQVGPAPPPATTPST